MALASVLPLLFIFGQSYCYQGELLASVVIFRDGERTPVKSFPDDPWRAKWESIGYGQLTTQGKERLFQLGRWLRQRYDKHIPIRYTKNSIFVRSIDYDEAITSAYMLLAGLYPPLEDQVFDESLKWQPIPVHTESISNDHLLTGSDCKQLDNVERISFRSLEGLEDDRVWLEKHFNIPPNENVTLIEVVETILSAISMNLEDKPEWTNDAILANLEHKVIDEMEVTTSTPDLAKLKLGPLFFEITKYFGRFLPGAPEDDYQPKFKTVFYAGVMETLVNILHGLKIVGILDIPDHIPRFAATLLMELRDGGSGKRYMNILYKNSTATIRQYSITDCGMDCDYGVFLDKIKPITAQYDHKHCEHED
ncbi:hypothetical protein HHI36_021156 [Cryptolaemus montrouzieri]|uniref:Uncharacterized protein n=1 Tax=Cryptolaemus montrouzieri TaxID=559131 RepID=A0ABD2MWS3_9CUCU